MLWGIDLGGTKIECAIIESAQNIEPICRERIATEGHLGYEHIIGQVVKLVDKVKAVSGISPATIGIGTPGALEPSTQLMKNCNTTSLIGKPFKADLEKALGIPIRIANDANCFALAEARMGAANTYLPNAEVIFGIIMGTGVGGGIVVNHKVINGRHGLGGEWGHNFLDESGGMCYCGRVGCVETMISGPALERFYLKQCGKALKLKEIVSNYETGNDSAAELTMKQLVTYFGKAVGPIINIIDPEAIVIGGGVGNIDILYTEGVEEVKKYVFNSRLDTMFLKPTLGDSAGVFGAAIL
ncbi:MAG: ROK family protein [Saprospiraceae bacterium]